ncbi:MAG: AAA family ATPase [Candidatus Woesearchaeota archaeon]
MALFDDILKSNESLFMDAVVLDYDYLPKLIPYREKEQKHIALCIKPLFSHRNGTNILIHGPPGVGKTAAVKHIFKELEETTDEVIPIYINVWQKNTSFKVVIDICEQLDYVFTQNKKTEELFKIIENQLNKKAVVFCFDEIDKAEDLDFLYYILEKIYRKTIILITNYKEWAIDLDERLKSRLNLELLEFRKYNESEIKGILEERKKYAFVPNVWDNNAFLKVAKKTAEIGDVRTGLYLLKEAGNIAENRASRKIEIQDVEQAISKIAEIKTKKTEELKEDEQLILNIIKENSGKKIGDLFNIYKQKGGLGVYKTFQRKIDFLSKNNFISTKKQTNAEGNTTIVKYERETKLDEF